MSAVWLVSTHGDCTAWPSEQAAQIEVSRLAPKAAVAWLCGGVEDDAEPCDAHQAAGIAPVGANEGGVVSAVIHALLGRQIEILRGTP